MNPESKNEFVTPAHAIWIDLKTAAQLKGITTRALRLALNKGKYFSRETFTQGGKTSEILLSNTMTMRFYMNIEKMQYKGQLAELKKKKIG